MPHLKDGRYSDIVSVLLHFGDDDVLAWFQQHRNHDGSLIQSPQNLLSLSPQLQSWWYNLKFALKPLRKQEDGIVVQRHWLKLSTLAPTDKIPIGANLSESVDPQGWGDDCGNLLVHHKSGRRIKTGHTFVIRAENPEHLPSFDLLEVQWNIARVATISGLSKVPGDHFTRQLRDILQRVSLDESDQDDEP